MYQYSNLPGDGCDHLVSSLSSVAYTGLTFMALFNLGGLRWADVRIGRNTASVFATLLQVAVGGPFVMAELIKYSGSRDDAVSPSRPDSSRVSLRISRNISVIYVHSGRSFLSLRGYFIGVSVD